MRWAVFNQAVSFVLVLSLASGSRGAEGGLTTRTGMAVWDTGQPSAGPWTPAALAKAAGWTLLPAEKTAVAFQGDAVISNGRILAVLRKNDPAAQVYSLGPSGAIARLRLLPLTAGGEPPARLKQVTLVENTKSAVGLEAAFQTAEGASLVAKFRIKRGDLFLATEPGPGTARLRIDCPSRFAVLPDFFADDIVIDPGKIPLASIEVPSENFLLHMMGQGEAIAMPVFENQKQDVKVLVAGTGDQRVVTGSEVGFEGKKVWVAFLEAPRIWHSLTLNARDTDQVIPLGWKMPFAAQWRVDFTRTNDLIDSWEMLLQEKKDGDYTKPSWLGGGDQTVPSSRKRWNTVLGTFPYPCWSNPDRQGYLQPLKKAVLQFQGPVVIYPINRVNQTPLEAYTVVDIMRNTLGVGPCEHILDLEGQKSEFKGRATCGVRDKLTPIYTNGQQKQKRAEIDKTLDEGLIFVTHIRGRITRYVEFGNKMRSYLADQKKVHPELTAFIDEMDQVAREIDTRVAARADKIKTPAHVAQMNADFRKRVLDADGPDALTKCKEYTKALVVIGDNQDELSGECRWVVKTLRQRAGIRMALDPKVAPIAAEIRARTQEALRNPANHEGARH